MGLQEDTAGNAWSLRELARTAENGVKAAAELPLSAAAPHPHLLLLQEEKRGMLRAGLRYDRARVPEARIERKAQGCQ
jgi:hypothetical protein